MPKNNRKEIEKIFKEMYDLKIKYQIYGEIIVTAITNIATCKFNDDEAGAKAWTDIQEGYTLQRKLIETGITDLHTLAMKLKEEMTEDPA